MIPMDTISADKCVLLIRNLKTTDSEFSPKTHDYCKHYSYLNADSIIL